MSEIPLIDLFLIIFVGMGPVKVLFVFLDLTEGLEHDVRRQVARRTVLVAGGVGLVQLFFGVLFKALLHFSIGALTVAGGLILLLLAIRLVLGGGESAPQGGAAKDPMSLAISPLGLPFTLNPSESWRWWCSQRRFRTSGTWH